MGLLFVAAAAILGLVFWVTLALPAYLITGSVEAITWGWYLACCALAAGFLWISQDYYRPGGGV